MTKKQPARVIGCLAIENSLPLIHLIKNNKQGIIHQNKIVTFTNLRIGVCPMLKKRHITLILLVLLCV